MKIYIVLRAERGFESDIIAVFLRLSKAEQYVKNLGDEYYLEEYKVNI